MTPLGMYVKRCREQRGWTIADLSRQSGVPYGTIRNIEQNQRSVKPQEETLRALAGALGAETLDLLFAIAGYGIPMSPDIESRNHVVDRLMVAHPAWREVLHRIALQTPEKQDQMLQVLRVFEQMDAG